MLWVFDFFVLLFLWVFMVRGVVVKVCLFFVLCLC